jgi:hypothetical protein
MDVSEMACLKRWSTVQWLTESVEEPSKTSISYRYMQWRASVVYMHPAVEPARAMQSDGSNTMLVHMLMNFKNICVVVQACE